MPPTVHHTHTQTHTWVHMYTHIHISQRRWPVTYSLSLARALPFVPLSPCECVFWSAVNYTNGVYAPGVQPPFDTGFEAVGRVERCGEGVSKVKEGDWIAYSAFGAFSELMCLDSRAAVPIPKVVMHIYTYVYNTHTHARTHAHTKRESERERDAHNYTYTYTHIHTYIHTYTSVV